MAAMEGNFDVVQDIGNSANVSDEEEVCWR